MLSFVKKCGENGYTISFAPNVLKWHVLAKIHFVIFLFFAVLGKFYLVVRRPMLSFVVKSTHRGFLDQNIAYCCEVYRFLTVPFRKVTFFYVFLCIFVLVKLLRIFGGRTSLSGGPLYRVCRSRVLSDLIIGFNRKSKWLNWIWEASQNHPYWST